MEERTGDGGGRRVRARVLAEELRAVIEALAVCDTAEVELARATELAAELRRTVEGPRRPRWYEASGDAMEVTDESRRAYLDQSPIRGLLNPIAPPLRTELVERSDGTRAIRGHARLRLAYEGPPHGVHGGWVAALFDDLLGAAQALTDSRAVTGKLEVRYRHVTPVEEELRLESWIDEVRGRRITARATCHAGETLTADAQALFVGVDFNEMQQRMRARRS